MRFHGDKTKIKDGREKRTQTVLVTNLYAYLKWNDIYRRRGGKPIIQVNTEL